MKVNKWLLTGLVSTAVVGVAIGVLAASMFSKDVPTGTFTTGSEVIDLTTETWKLDCGFSSSTFTCTNPVEVSDGSWLQKAFEPTGESFVIGAVKLTNTSTVSTVNTYMTTKDVANIAGLADALDVKVKVAPNGQPADAGCSGNDMTYINEGKLSALPAFGDPTEGDQAGDIVIAPGTSQYVCILVGLGEVNPPIYEGSASATFTFGGDNAP